MLHKKETAEKMNKQANKQRNKVKLTRKRCGTLS